MITMIIELNKSKQAFANNVYYVFMKINGFFSFPTACREFYRADKKEQHGEE